MRVEPLVPDVAPVSPSPDPGGFAAALDAVGRVLSDASASEDAYAGGAGSLQQAVYTRARADVALAVAAATVQRAAQAVQTFLNLQV